MHELDDLVTTARPEPAPSTETVTRHRMQLRAAIATADPTGATTADDRAASTDGEAPVVELTGRSDRRAGGWWRRSWPRLAATAAAIAVLVATGAVVVPRLARSDGAGVATSGDEGLRGSEATSPAGSTPSDDGQGTSPAPSTGAAPTATVAPLACGPQLPFAIPAPDGYAGPVDGPGGDAATDPRPDQLVRHWTAPTGTIEVRWPADADPRTDGWNAAPTDDASQRPDDGVQPEQSRSATPDRAGETAGSGVQTGVTETISGEPRPTPAGRLAMDVVITSPDLGVDACGSVQLVFAHEDAMRARQLGSHVNADLFEPGGPLGGPDLPLVARSISADAPPDVPACQAPPGVDHVDRQGGPVQGIGTFATPEEALQAFIDTKTVTDVDAFGVEVEHTTIGDRGYTAMTLPDDTIAYVHEVGAGRTIVHATPTGDGWTIDHWEATGC